MRFIARTFFFAISRAGAFLYFAIENFARADELQQLERENFDLEVVNRELDARLTVRLRVIEQGVAQELEPGEELDVTEGLQ